MSTDVDAPKETSGLLLPLTWLGATLVTLALYGAGVGASFVLDDFAWLDCAADAAVDPGHIFTLHISSFWRPLVHLIFLVASWIFGLSPLAFHLLAVAAHGLVAALLGRLVLALSDDLQAAVLASAIFVVLPVHGEVVLWISALTESIHAAAALLALIAFVGFVRAARGRWIRYALFLLAFALALTAKESAVVVLPLLPLLRRLLAWRRPGGAPPAVPWWSWLPPLALLTAYLGLQLQLLRTSHLIATEAYGLGAHGVVRVGRALWALLSTCWPLVAAIALGALVARWRQGGEAWRPGARSAALIGLAGLLVLTPLAPYVWFREEAVASRYLYLSTAAAAGLLAVALRQLLARGRAAQLLGLLALLGVAAQGALVAGRAAQRHREAADETAAFVRAAAARPAPRLPVRIIGAPLRGQHLAGAMRLFHPTRSRRFRGLDDGGHTRRLEPDGGSVWRWHRATRRLEELIP